MEREFCGKNRVAADDRFDQRAGNHPGDGSTVQTICERGYHRGGSGCVAVGIEPEHSHCDIDSRCHSHAREQRRPSLGICRGARHRGRIGRHRGLHRPDRSDWSNRRHGVRARRCHGTHRANGSDGDRTRRHNRTDGANGSDRPRGRSHRSNGTHRASRRYRRGNRGQYGTDRANRCYGNRSHRRNGTHRASGRHRRGNRRQYGTDRANGRHGDGSRRRNGSDGAIRYSYRSAR